jgi:hypothetical protein
MVTLQQLEERLRAIRSQHGVEERRVFVRLRDNGDTVALEVSDGDALGRLAGALRAATNARVQAVQLPSEDLRSRVAWVSASVAAVRRHAAHGGEQVTQALQGEVLEPLLHENGWLLVRLHDGYVGWVRDWHVQLGQPARSREHASRADARVAQPWLRLHEAPSAASPACAETVLGTRVVRTQREDSWSEIELPGGRRGWVPDTALRSGVEDWPCTPASILEMIALFRGSPYVWGGRSPKGFDCSGLVQFVFGLHGVHLPRDSDQQFEVGIAVESLTAGDLLFFGRESIGHVAVALDAHAYLHARGEVRRNSLDPASPHYDPELAAIYRGGRRVLPQME